MKTFHLLSVLLGAALLTALVWVVGPGALWRELGLLGWGLVPLILIEGVAELFHAAGWRCCLSGPLRSLPFWDVLRIRMAGFAINYLTPTASLGGEVTKGTLLSLAHRGPEAVSGVIVGKLSYSLTQLVLAVVGSVVVLWQVELPTGVWPALLGGSLLLAVGIVGFLIVQREGRLGSVVRWLAGHRIGGKALARLADQITRVDGALKRFYREQPLDLPRSMAWHAAGMVCGMVQGWLFLLLLTERASPALGAGIWLLGTWFDLLAFALPADIGVLEGTRILVFRLLGFRSSLGLTFGVALRLEQLFWSGAGLAAYGSLLARSRREGGPAPKGVTGTEPEARP